MMEDLFKTLPFQPAHILLPQNCDLSLWSVVACDQYTSQPEYWQRVEEQVGENPSALRLILPESGLNAPNVAERIGEIDRTMERYLEEGRFRLCPNGLIYLERTLEGGKIRRGLVGMVDLEQYDYTPGSGAPVRATEGTILSRIPPRVAVRRNAPIELTHVMLLADDRKKTVIEPLAAHTGEMEPVYDFELMEGGGHIRGWLLTGAQRERVAGALSALADPAVFRAEHDTDDVLLFAVGDGNHSLATAKACWEEQKKNLPPERRADHPARYALCELVNLHDEALTFEPIHRVVFGADPEELLADLTKTGGAFPELPPELRPTHALPYVRQGEEGVAVAFAASRLPAGTLQKFLDRWLADHPEARVDYIHGEQVARHLAQRPDAIAFLMPAMGKEELFPTVIHDGVLPRKTFSMGEAQEKRFYLEARKIRD